MKSKQLAKLIPGKPGMRWAKYLLFGQGRSLFLEELFQIPPP